ncbi:ankyrin repeat-containing domain protein [Diplogelasinospora grovesii]|uniref:Ankyrin repeat-containing domain protein n=1 Tax=Diplogelasinospora grovesii TaxID=303347 RepID=A0AAN6NFK4_9PEZI|nr:ankyrin repeat-containing domain protein [Diplogelasinospora grovesii]
MSSSTPLSIPLQAMNVSGTAAEVSLEGVRGKRKPRGRLDVEKCSQCRKDKKKCTPQGRDASQKCDRCAAMGLDCSPNTKKRRTTTQVSDNEHPAAVQVVSPDSICAGGNKRLTHGVEEPDWTYPQLLDAINILHVSSVVAEKFNECLNNAYDTFGEDFDPSDPGEAALREFRSFIASLRAELFRRIESRLGRVRNLSDHQSSLETALLRQYKSLLFYSSTVIFSSLSREGVNLDNISNHLDDLHDSQDFGTACRMLETQDVYSPAEIFRLLKKRLEQFKSRVADLAQTFALSFPTSILDCPCIWGPTFAEFFDCWIIEKWWDEACSELKDLISVFPSDAFKSTVFHLLAEGMETKTRHTERYINRLHASVKGVFASVDINARDLFGRTALDIASQRNLIDVVKFLLTNGASWKAETEDKRTALHYAAALGHLDVCGVLLGAGADINTLDARQTTPFFYAVQNGHIQVMRMLMDSLGFDLRFELGPLGSFSVAVFGECEAAALMMMAHRDFSWGALIDIFDTDARGAFQLFGYASTRHMRKLVEAMIEAMGSHVNRADNDGNTALAIAARQEDITAVRLLLSNHHIDAGKPNRWNETPLHTAARKGNMELCSLLAPRPDSRLFEKSEDGMTAYGIAVAKGYQEIAKLLADLMSLVLASGRGAPGGYQGGPPAAYQAPFFVYI